MSSLRWKPISGSDRPNLIHSTLGSPVRTLDPTLKNTLKVLSSSCDGFTMRIDVPRCIVSSQYHGRLNTRSSYHTRPFHPAQLQLAKEVPPSSALLCRGPSGDHSRAFSRCELGIPQ